MCEKTRGDTKERQAKCGKSERRTHIHISLMSLQGISLHYHVCVVLSWRLDNWPNIFLQGSIDDSKHH